MSGYRNPREQVGYINVGLLCHCVLDGKCRDVLIDSLATLVNPAYEGRTPFRDLVFQRYQEWDVLDRVLRARNMTPSDLLAQVVAGTHKPFFSALAREAVLDAEYRDCRVPPSVRVRKVEVTK